MWIGGGSIGSKSARCCARKGVREAVCAGNEGALKRVRDTSENGMTVCAAVRSREQLNEAEDVRSSGRQQLPGLTIIIQNTPLRAEPLDVTPLPAPIETPKPLPEGVFRPPRRR
jgi:hypothetical protein